MLSRRMRDYLLSAQELLAQCGVPSMGYTHQTLKTMGEVDAHRVIAEVSRELTLLDDKVLYNYVEDYMSEEDSKDLHKQISTLLRCIDKHAPP